MYLLVCNLKDLYSKTSMTLTILERIRSVETRLLEAASDELSLVAFCNEWQVLEKDIARAIVDETIDHSTVGLIQIVSQRIKILATSLYDTEAKATQLRSDMISEAATILDSADSNASTGCPSIQRTPLPICSSSLLLDDKRHPCPPYIASAYKWLRHNLHKPYPTVEEVKSICANSNTSEKRIRNWFISARQRMGWTKIAKQHFHLDREDTADAAYRALVEPDLKRPVDAKLVFEFVKMQVAAEGMYSMAFKPSQFAGSLGAAVVGMSAEHKACIEQMRQQAMEEENVRCEVEYQMKRQRASKRSGSQRRSVSLYPSPERSPNGSPEPTLILSEAEDEPEISLPSTAASRKRRCSSSDQFDSHVDKRFRYAIHFY
jgi:hypothetical protein